MRQVADDLYLLRGFPPNAFNVYLAGGVLVDSGTKLARRRIVSQLEGRDVTAHALTHAHSDHQGSSHAVCEALGIPFWVSEGDARAAETGDLTSTIPPNRLAGLSARMAGPAHPVARRLHEGDEVGGFTVVETPGHSPGHVSYWREADRALIVGDTLFGLHPLTGIPGLHMPPDIVTVDPSQNRASARKLAALEPALMVFGHGPPWRDTRGFVEFVEALPGS
jgi:glyoxylase-like metal-dependent hydrolase (beta-lactamase superfamily II)